MKVQMNISVNAEIAKDAKVKLSGRVSAICEKALRLALGQDINIEEELRVCNRCKKPNEDMIWDGFAEMWICPNCNNKAIKNVSIMSGTGRKLV